MEGEAGDPAAQMETDKTSAADEDEKKSERWQIEHVVMPAVREYLVPPRSLLGDPKSKPGNGAGGAGSAVVQVASLPDLYRVFERC